MTFTDPVTNFAIVEVSTGYTSAATSIALSTGEGAKLPAPSTDGPFNLVWWDSTNYPNPADDPNREIIRVTARSTDTLTVSRAQESTSATNKNTGGATYKMALVPTQNTRDIIESYLQGVRGSNIASASSIDIGAATGQGVTVTGTTTITALGTADAGTFRRVTFSGALTLTHNATSLILPTGANITTAAGDMAGFESLGSGNWRCLWYTRANGTPLASSSGGGASNFASGYKSSDQSSISSSPTKITFPNENFDTGGDFDTTNSKYTAPSDGKYLVNVNLRFTNITSNDYHIVYLYKNGSAIQTYGSEPENDISSGVTSGVTARRTNFSTVVNLSAGDYLELYTESGDTSYTCTGGTAGSGNRGEFQVCKLA